MSHSASVIDKSTARWETLLLAGLLIATFIPFLSETLFTTKGEPREAIVAVSMLNQGNWILPVSFGADIPYKPPMLAWCIALLGWLNGGHVTEFLSRLPSALSAIAMVMMTFRFFSRRSPGGVALGAALVCAGAFEVFRAATICRVDMLLTFFMVGALYALYRQWERHPRGTWMPSVVAALFMSGAVLTKGPIGMLLPCMVLFVFRLIKGGGFVQTTVSLALSGLLSLLLPALWYVAAYARGGEPFLELVLEENFGRFTGSMTYGSHEHPVLYNFTSLLSGFAPYTLLLLISLFACPWRHIKKGSGNLLQRLRAMDPVELFAMLAALLVFVFYCIPKSKRSVYLLPMYPFMAYFMALYLRRLISIAPACVRVYGWILAVLGVIAPLAILSVMSGAVAPFGSGSTAMILNGFAAEGTRILPSAVCYLTLLSAITLIWVLLRRSPRSAAMGSMVFTLVLYWMVQGASLPACMNYKSDRDMAHRIEEAVPAQEGLYAFRYGRMERFFTLGYYLDDRLHRFDVDHPEKGVLVIAACDLPSFAEEVATGYRFDEPIELGRSGEAKTDMLLVGFTSAD